MMRWISAFLLSVICLFAEGELSNRRAPGFSLPDITFRQHDLMDYRGKVVVLDIMQTTCPQCRILAKTLERIRLKYGDRIKILTIVNPPDNQATVSNFTSTFGVKSTFLFDCGQAAAAFMLATPQKPEVHLPHLFVIDGEGMIRNDFSFSDATKSIFEGDGLIPKIDALLGAQPQPAVKK